MEDLGTQTSTATNLATGNRWVKIGDLRTGRSQRACTVLPNRVEVFVVDGGVNMTGEIIREDKSVNIGTIAP